MPSNHTEPEHPPLSRAWREYEVAVTVEDMARRAARRGESRATGLRREASRHHAVALELQAHAFAVLDSSPSLVRPSSSTNSTNIP